MVITRRRPDTAKGFIFRKLEDERRLVNVNVNVTVAAALRSTTNLSRPSHPSRHAKRRPSTSGERA
ncbi:MAG: hypothetical protein GIX02_09000 [Candidatus Eremiobacteraeota bacterium]|nr:hypothetical protein [Candidatus Eremiobacteraeota bacterium]